MKNLVRLQLKAGRNRLAFSLAVFAVATLGSALPAKADSFTTLVGRSDPNLQAFLYITSLTNSSITFILRNKQVPGVTSTITGIGFDLPGAIQANTEGVCVGWCGSFTPTPIVDNAPGNVPGSQADLDWALTTGPNFAGGNPRGIDPTQNATFTVTGAFTGLTRTQFLNGAYVRFQSVSDPDFPDVDGDVARSPGAPTPISVPEPASVLALGIGLLVLAARRHFSSRKSSDERRRRAAAESPLLHAASAAPGKEKKVNP